MKIGEVARLAGVRVDTLRFYERRGVLPAPARKPSGYRDYAPGTVDRILFARELQRLGFTLDEIADLLAAMERGAATCARERKRFEAVRARIDQRLVELRAVRRRLGRTLARCASGKCRLLERPSRR